MAERISKYVSKRGREDMNEWVDKEIKDDGYKEGIKKFANKLSEDKGHQDIILEQHNQTLMVIDTRIAQMKERTDPKILNKLVDDKIYEALNSEEEAKKTITVDNVCQQVINEVGGANSMRDKRRIILKALENGGLAKEPD